MATVSRLATLGRELISDAPDRPDISGFGRIVLNLVTQSRHAYIDAAVKGVPLESAKALHDEIAAQDSVRVRYEDQQQIEFSA